MIQKPDLETELWSARQAISRIQDGSLGLPDFQRRFEWTSADVKAFLSTVLAGLPSGTLMVAENRNLALELRQLDGAPPLTKPIDSVLVLLDGQQRLTALYHAATNTGPDRYVVDATALLEGADLLQEDVIISISARSYETRMKDAEGERILIPVSSLLDSATFLAWRENFDHRFSRPVSRSIKDRLGDLFAEHLASVAGYKLPVIKLGGSLDLSTTAQVFERTNKWGQKLDAFDLMVARLRAGGWNLRDAWNAATSFSPSIQRVFGSNGLPAISAIALREHGDVRRNAVLSLRSKLVEKLWPRIESACDEISAALISSGFQRSDLIPYDVALSNMIALRLDGHPIDSLVQYLWRVGANRRYEVASNTSVVSDYKTMRDGVIVEELEEHQLTTEVVERNSRRSSRALWATLVATMLSLEPYDLVTGVAIADNPDLSEDSWDLTSFTKGGGSYESEYDTPARLRTAGHLLFLRRGGSALRNQGLRSVVEKRLRQPWLYGPSIEDCLSSQLMPRDAGELFRIPPRELIHIRASILTRILIEHGWG